MAPLAVYAAAPAEFTQNGIVNGDGVRLRTSPVNGTVLGLMYYPEKIKLSSRVDNNYPAWVYIWREKPEQIGWMEWSYFTHG